MIHNYFYIKDCITVSYTNYDVGVMNDNWQVSNGKENISIGFCIDIAISCFQSYQFA